MLWWPIVMGGTYAAGTNSFWQFIWNRKISLEQALWAGGVGAGLSITTQLLTKAWQNWLQQQFLYRLAEFQKTRLYSDLLWLKNNSKFISIYATAAVAGGILGAAVGIGVSQTVWGQSGREEAIEFYSGDVSFTQWADVVEGLQNKMAAQLTFFLQALHQQVLIEQAHDPSDFSYSFGMDKTQENPSPSQDFPLGLGPGGAVY